MLKYLFLTVNNDILYKIYKASAMFIYRDKIVTYYYKRVRRNTTVR